MSLDPQADSSDEDGIPDYLDQDDDNDNVPTINEIDTDDIDGDGDPTNNLDTDGDGNPDYLDIDDDGDGVNTILEDEDQDMNPRNDLNVGPDGVTIIPHYLNTLETTDHGNPGLTDTNIYTRTVTINFLIIDFNLEILSSDAIDFGTLTYSFNLPDDED